MHEKRRYAVWSRQIAAGSSCGYLDIDMSVGGGTARACCRTNIESDHRLAKKTKERK